MPQYHYHTQIIGRSKKGRATAASAYVSGSVVAGAAYRSGEKIICEWDQRTHDYTHKSGVVYTEIILPKNASIKFLDRSILWNSVELKNKRKDAQLARETDMALPRELSLDQQIECVREYIDRNYTSEGICADLAIHDNGNGNPHVHIMFTMDKVTEKGFGTRLEAEKDYNYHHRKQRLLKWREDWATVCNKHLEKAGISERIDHRSFKDRGIDKTPTIHMGKEATRLEKQGIKTPRGNQNRVIIYLNAEREKRKIKSQQEQARQEEQTRIELERQQEFARQEAERQAKIKDLYANMHDIQAEYENIANQINRLNSTNNEYWKDQWRTMHRAKDRIDDITKYRTRITQIEQEIKESLHYQANLSIFKKKQKSLLGENIEKLKEEKERIERYVKTKYNLSDIEDSKIVLSGVESRKNIYSKEIGKLRKQARTLKDNYNDHMRQIHELNTEHQRQQLQEQEHIQQHENERIYTPY